MKELIFEKQDENSIWEDSIRENLMWLLLNETDLALLLKNTKISSIRLYKERIKELDDSLYTFEVNIIIDNKIIKINKIEYLKKIFYLKHENNEQFLSSMSVNGRRKNIFEEENNPMKLHYFIKKFLPIPKLTGEEYAKIEYILFEVENILYRAIQELELWYIHRHNLMPRNLDVHEPIHPDDLPF